MWLRGSLPVRPRKLGSVDPHAMQDDRELTCNGVLYLSAPTHFIYVKQEIGRILIDANRTRFP
jgi:hypothetical protein